MVFGKSGRTGERQALLSAEKTGERICWIKHIVVDQAMVNLSACKPRRHTSISTLFDLYPRNKESHRANLEAALLHGIQKRGIQNA